MTMGGLRGVWVFMMFIATIVNANNIFIQMPNVQPLVHDTYMCTGLKLNKTDYIVSFTPKQSKPMTAHHILLYGCTEPGYEKGAWNCGEMQTSSDKKIRTGPTCRAGAKIIYAWAMEAPNLELPKGVGFKIGEGSDIKWLVLQIHFKDVDRFKNKHETDNSGLDLKLAKKPTPKGAGTIIVGTGGMIKPHTTVYMEAACKYDDNVVIHPFAYRTHAHAHGVVNSGYRIRNGVWTEIGRKSPQKPEMFYKVADKHLTIKKGDTIAARCTMVNKDDKMVQVGPTAADEMCNFYIMYYTDGKTLPNADNCWSPGPPNWSWHENGKKYGINDEDVPKTASTDPDSGISYPETKGNQEDEDEEEDRERQNEFEDYLQQRRDFLRDELLAERYDADQNEYERQRRMDEWVF